MLVFIFGAVCPSVASCNKSFVLLPECRLTALQLPQAVRATLVLLWGLRKTHVRVCYWKPVALRNCVTQILIKDSLWSTAPPRTASGYPRTSWTAWWPLSSTTATWRSRGYFTVPRGYIPVPRCYIPVPRGYIPVPRCYILVPLSYIPVPRGYILVLRGYIPVPRGYIKKKKMKIVKST